MQPAPEITTAGGALLRLIARYRRQERQMVARLAEGHAELAAAQAAAAWSDDESTAARAVPFPAGHSAYTPAEARAKAAEVGLDCAPSNDIGAALEDLLATQPAPMRILICGSLYLAGEVLARNA